MKLAYIDCGSFDGDTYRRFLNTWPNAASFESYLFEPDARIEGPAQTRREAAWVHDGSMEFFYGDPQSSTLVHDKTTGAVDYTHPIIVPCFDLARWVQRFDGYDQVVLKLDIEGAEYAVLEHMLEQSVLGIVTHLYVDWHWYKIGVSEQVHHALISRIKYVTGLVPEENFFALP